MKNATENWITICTFTYSHETLVVESLLELDEIPYFLKDELQVQMNPMYSNALGGIKLQVHPKDKDKAIQLLTSAGLI